MEDRSVFIVSCLIVVALIAGGLSALPQQSPAPEEPSKAVPSEPDPSTPTPAERSDSTAQPQERLRSSSRPIVIDNCGTITVPGNYILTRNIMNGGRGDQYTFASQTCLTIRTSHVILDGRGHTIDGMEVKDTTGIAVAGNRSLTNVTIRNVTLTDWNRGLYLQQVSNATVRTVTVTNNAYGISIENTTAVQVQHVTVQENIIGIYLLAAANSTELYAVTFTGNHAEDVVVATEPALRFETESLLNRSTAIGPSATSPSVTSVPEQDKRGEQHRSDDAIAARPE